MAIGNIYSVQQLNSMAAQIAGSWKTVAEDTVFFASYMNGLGNGGLVTLGFAGADATAMLQCVDYMLTMAQVFQGAATQASEFNFQDALVPLTGPN